MHCVTAYNLIVDQLATAWDILCTPYLREYGCQRSRRA